MLAAVFLPLEELFELFQLDSKQKIILYSRNLKTSHILRYKNYLDYEIIIKNKHVLLKL